MDKGDKEASIIDNLRPIKIRFNHRATPDCFAGHKRSWCGRFILSHLRSDLQLAAIAEVFRDASVLEGKAANLGLGPSAGWLGS